MAAIYTYEGATHTSTTGDQALAIARALAAKAKPLVAVTGKDAIVILAVLRKASKLQHSEQPPKVTAINGRGTVFAFAGFISDAQRLLSAACSSSCSTIEGVANDVSEVYYSRILNTTFRPVSVFSLIAGFDSTGLLDFCSPPLLFALSPEASVVRWHAVALGDRSSRRQSILEKGWREGMETDEAIALAGQTLFEGDTRDGTVQVTVIERGGAVRTLSADEITSLLPLSSLSGRVGLAIDEKDRYAGAWGPEDASPLRLATARGLTKLLHAMNAELAREIEYPSLPSTDQLVCMGIVGFFALVALLLVVF
ncbi:hypothetical protein JCM8547_002948 [Rhodosporidiobolus lusitaniae]